MFTRFFFIILLLVAITFHGFTQKEGNAVLKKHFATAGQELWNQINDVSVDGRWVDEDYRGRNIKLTFKAPDKIRIEGRYDKKTFIEAYNGAYGWILAPWKKKYEALQMNREEELLIRNSFSLGSPLYRYKDELHFTGLKPLEGEVYHTFVYEDDRVRKTFFLGKDDHKLYFETIELKVEGKEILKVYEKYRTYSGLSLPAAVRFEGDDLEKELVFDQVYIGLGANDAMFEAPAGQ